MKFASAGQLLVVLLSMALPSSERHLGPPIDRHGINDTQVKHQNLRVRFRISSVIGLSRFFYNPTGWKKLGRLVSGRRKREPEVLRSKFDGTFDGTPLWGPKRPAHRRHYVVNAVFEFYSSEFSTFGSVFSSITQIFSPCSFYCVYSRTVLFYFVFFFSILVFTGFNNSWPHTVVLLFPALSKCQWFNFPK